jgi:hypothetical protein
VDEDDDEPDFWEAQRKLPWYRRSRAWWIGEGAMTNPLVFVAIIGAMYLLTRLCQSLGLVGGS